METVDLVQMKYVVSALVYAGIGIAVLVGSFLLLDIATPKVQIWKELVEEKNLALAIFLGSVAIGIAMIISSAIHG